MKIRYSFYTEYTPELAGYLESLGFAPEDILDYGNIRFKLYDHDQRLKSIKEKFPDLRPVQAKYEYSRTEMERAQWFTLRPTNSNLDACFEELTFAGSCLRQAAEKGSGRAVYSHYSQRAPYIMSRQAKWGRSQFMACGTNRIPALFCSDLARNIIERSGLRGCAFAPVLYYKDASPMPDINQFIIETVIPGDRVKVQGAKDIGHCPWCGREKYIVDALSRPAVDLGALGELDFYATEQNHAIEMDAPEKPYFILSRRAYTVFREHGMTRSFEVLPLLTLDFGNGSRKIEYGKNEVPACTEGLKANVEEHFTAHKKQMQAERKASAEKWKTRIEKEDAGFAAYCQRHPDSVMPAFRQELSERGYRTEIFMDVVRAARLHGEEVLPLAWKYYRQAKYEYEKILLISLFCFKSGGNYLPQLLEDYAAVDTPEERRTMIARCIYENRAKEYADEYERLMADSRYGQSRQMLILAAGELKLENAVPTLLRLLEDKECGLYALLALAAYRREAFRPYFQALKVSDDPQMRKAAIMAIQKLEKGSGDPGQ